MSETENINIVKQLFSAIDNQDLNAALALLSKEIELIHPMPKTIWPWAGEQHGHEGIMGFYAGALEVIDIVQFEPREFITQNDKVVVLMFERFHIKASCKDVDNDFVMVFTLRDAKIIKWHIYEDTAPIIKALDGATKENAFTSKLR